LFERLNTEYGVQSGNSVKILTLLIRSNIHHSLKAILRGNIDQLSLELLVCKKIYFKFKKISVLLIYSKEVVLLLRNLPLRMGRMVFIKLNRKSNLQKN
jgi:hypothetical protein